MATRRRKIAHSVASRRVKPRKSKNAKRPKSKTFKRTSRNIVMNGGGIHKNLKVYVIQNPDRPKCVIIRQSSSPKDKIYLFFHSQMEPSEIKEFVYAAMGFDASGVGLDASVVIEPALEINEKYENTTLNGFCVRFSGNWNYSLFSAKIAMRLLSYKNRRVDDYVPISNYIFKEHTTTPNIKASNGNKIINNLQSITAKKGYTFTQYEHEYYFENEDFPVINVTGVLYDTETQIYNKKFKVFQDQCLTHPRAKEMSELLKELINMINNYKEITTLCDNNARKFAFDNSDLMSQDRTAYETNKNNDKQKTLDTIHERYGEIDFSKGTRLVEQINSHPLINCVFKVFLRDDSDAKSVENYITSDNPRKFYTIEEILDKTYNAS